MGSGYACAACAWGLADGRRAVLPIEFSYVSRKRKQALTLCLDPEHGTDCATHVIASKRATLGEALADLAEREIAPLHLVAGLCVSSGERHGIGDRDAQIANWCRASGWRGAVWTDLRSNFSQVAGHAFSVPAGLAWLDGLSADSLQEAETYIENAPNSADTALRRAWAQRRNGSQRASG